MATRPQTTSTHVPRNMDSWTHVFVRYDAVRGPLNFPYLGPSKYYHGLKKYFKLDMNGRTEFVSVDHLKKAHFECDITDLNVLDTPKFNPLQSPLITATPFSLYPSSTNTPPQTNKLYRTKSGRAVHWPKRLFKTHLK